jgi:hypothetical protein
MQFAVMKAANRYVDSSVTLRLSARGEQSGDDGLLSAAYCVVPGPPKCGIQPLLSPALGLGIGILARVRGEDGGDQRLFRLVSSACASAMAAAIAPMVSLDRCMATLPTGVKIKTN